MRTILLICKDKSCGYTWSGDKLDSECPLCDEPNIKPVFPEDNEEFGIEEEDEEEDGDEQ